MELGKELRMNTIKKQAQPHKKNITRKYFMQSRFEDISYQLFQWVQSVPLGFTITPFVLYFEKYVFSDWDSFAIIMTMFMVDTFVGIYKHWRIKDPITGKNTISREGFGKFFDKLVVCSVSLFLAEKFAQFGNANDLWYSMATAFGKASLMAYLALSTAENISQISGGKFPPIWIIKKLKFFQKSPAKLREEEEEKNDKI